MKFALKWWREIMMSILCLCLIISSVSSLGVIEELNSAKVAMAIRNTQTERLEAELEGILSTRVNGVSVEEAAEYIRECRDIHELFIERPELSSGGSAEWHQMWVDRYNSVLGLILGPDSPGIERDADVEWWEYMDWPEWEALWRDIRSASK